MKSWLSLLSMALGAARQPTPPLRLSSVGALSHQACILMSWVLVSLGQVLAPKHTMFSLQ